MTNATIPNLYEIATSPKLEKKLQSARLLYMANTGNWPLLITTISAVRAAGLSIILSVRTGEEDCLYLSISL